MEKHVRLVNCRICKNKWLKKYYSLKRVLNEMESIKTTNVCIKCLSKQLKQK